MLGVLKDMTGSMVTGLYVVAAIQVATGLIVILAFRSRRPASSEAG